MRSDILHVDLDAFYASVELRRRPELAGTPLVVGGDGPRGVVLSCSYEARAAGVRNGMPSMRAKRLCPRAVFVPPDFRAYREASRAFREVLDAVTPVVEPVSLDEAFCDVSGAHRLYGSTADIAVSVRERVAARTGITCSVGAGPSKIVAKMASRACKPDGMLVVADVEAFLHPLDVAALWGVGAATAQALYAVGLRTVGDVAAAPRWLLDRAVGEASGEHLSSIANGIDRSPVTTGVAAKSVGAEETFAKDLSSDDAIHREILRLADRVASRLVAGGLTARTITLKLRYATFETKTRSKTLGTATDDVWTINATARDAYASVRRGRRPVRLVGVTATGLVRGPAPEQLTLEPRPRYAEAGRAITRARERFGSGAVTFGALLPTPDE